MTIMSYLGAIGAAQREAMDANSRVIIMGEDVEANVYGTMGGGKSRADKGDFLQMYGSNRIRNTPISEEVMVGAAAGAAIDRKRGARANDVRGEGHRRAPAFDEGPSSRDRRERARSAPARRW